MKELCHQIRFVARLSSHARNVEKRDEHDGGHHPTVHGHIYNNGYATEDKTLDAKRMAQMAIVHDLAEAIVGDITPSDSIPKAQKKLLELDAMKKICSACPDKSVAELILNLFEEYETDETKESQICHDLDKLEMLFTAYSYERGLRCQDERKALNLQTTPLQNEQEHARADAIDLNEFFLSCRGKIRDERCQQWYLEILQARTGATQLDEP